MQDTERDSSQGAKLVWEAGESLETIFAAVEHQAREMDVINQVTMQQLQSFNAIENIMRLISQSSRQMNANTVKAAQDLEHLARQIEELHNSVGTFKLRQASPVLRTTISLDPVTPQSSGISRRLARFHAVTTPLSGGDISWAVPRQRHNPVSK